MIAAIVILLMFSIVIVAFYSTDSRKGVRANYARKIASLEKENRVIRNISDKLMMENRVLRDAAELGLPFPTVEALEKEDARIRAIIEKEINGSQE